MTHASPPPAAAHPAPQDSPALLALERRVGEEVGLSPWLAVGQDRIDAFAGCTGDHQWIHVDRGRAERESPFGTTIAHGFLTLSLLAPLLEASEALPRQGLIALNYGLDRVRFLTPVRSGARVRSRIRLERLEPRGGGHLATLEHSVEIEDEPKPALLATMLVLLLPAPEREG